MAINYSSYYNSRISSLTPMYMTDVKVGQIIKFMYKGKFRLVLVTTANYEEKLHGLTLESIPPILFDEVNTDISKNLSEIYIRENLPNFSEDDENQKLYNEIKNKIDKADAYRTYFINKIQSLQLITFK